MRQADLFDEQAAREAHKDGMGRVEDHAAPEWKDHALEAVRATARSGREFTVDDVWPNLAGGATHDLRAMGPVMKRAQRLRLIEPTGRFELARRISCHKCPRRVWRSLICDE